MYPNWCILEDGSLLFAREEPFDELPDGAEELGYTSCVNFTRFFPPDGYDCGQFCMKEDWTINDFAIHNWGLRIECKLDIPDPYELRDAVENEDWNTVDYILRNNVTPD